MDRTTKRVLEITIKRFNSRSSINEEQTVSSELIKAALEKALGDFTFRTTKKIDDAFSGGVEGLLELLSSDFLNRFDEYFTKPALDRGHFDKWHFKTCDLFIETVSEKYDIGYGKAQKIVNMTFKYLYCMIVDNGNFKTDYFQFCHTPLDSVVLDWIWEYKSKFPYDKLEGIPENIKFLKKYFSSWNNLDYISDLFSNDKFTYMFYQKIIREYCSDKGITPLQLDFIVWQQFQWEQAANEFIKQTNKLLGTNDDIPEKANEKKEKIMEIVNRNKNFEFYEW